MERIAMITVCDHCKHAKWASEIPDRTLYCEILKKKGEKCIIQDGGYPMSYDLSEKCGNSFEWDGDMKSIVRALEWLSERWNDLDVTEYRLAIVRVDPRTKKQVFRAPI